MFPFFVTVPANVNPADPINPEVTGVAFFPGGNGERARLQILGNYFGPDSLVVDMAFGDSADSFAVTGSQLEAQSGGTGVIAFSTQPAAASGGVFAFDEITEPSELTVVTTLADMATANRMSFRVREENNGGAASVETVTVSGLDAVVAAFSLATTDTQGGQVIVTASEALFGTPVLGEATVNVNGSPVALNAISLDGSTIVVTLASVVTDTDTLTVSYSNASGGVVDNLGNPLTAFTAQSVTNAVDGAAEIISITGTTFGLRVEYTGNLDFTGSTILVATVSSPQAPAQMGPPEVTVVSGTSLSWDVSLDEVNDGGSPITSYDLRYSTDENTWTTITGMNLPEVVTGLTEGALYYGQTRAVNAVGAGEWSLSTTATPLDTVTLSAYTEDFTASPPTFGFTVSAEGNGKTLFYEFHSGAVYPGRGNGDIASGNLGAVTAGSNAPELGLSEFPGETGYVFFTVGAPGQSNVIPVTPNPLTIDARPVLTSPTDAANGATAATGSVSTDVGDGTLYWVVTTSATAPTRAQVEAGQDHTGAAAVDSGSQAVSATGAQTLSPAPSGLTASTTYYIHFMHKRASEVESLVVSADGFTTDSASGFAVNEGASTGTFTTSNGFRIWTATDGDQLVVTTGGNVNAIIVGGGGGGGGRRGGGGGAGEYIARLTSGTPLALTPQTYTATVGAGGAGGNSAVGGDGGNSSFAGLTALGGGGGGSFSTAGRNGGSGGGAGSTTATFGTATAATGLGNDGGLNNSNSNGGGGGGGAGGPGLRGPSNVGGDGGPGVASPVPGESGFYAGGGGGGVGADRVGLGGSGVGGDGGMVGVPPTAGAAGTGSGGGGGKDDGVAPNRIGEPGGSGTVKVWWPA